VTEVVTSGPDGIQIDGLLALRSLPRQGSRCSQHSSLRWHSGRPLVKPRMAERTLTYRRGYGSQVPLPPSSTAWRRSWSIRRGGYDVPLISARVGRVGTWMLAGLMTLGALANIASSGDWERFGWGPFALVLGILCSALARSHRGSS